MPPSRIPPPLQPYISAQSPGSLTLLTNILGASTNWLVLRYLCDALSEVKRDAAPAVQPENGQRAEVQNGERAVILVSFLRDFEFWKTEGRRAAGLDLNKLLQQKRLAFVDGITELYTPKDASQSHTKPPSTTMPMRSPIPARGPGGITPRGPPQPMATQQPSSPTTPNATSKPEGIYPLTSPTLKTFEATLKNAISYIHTLHPSIPITLILDSPDLLLACSPPMASSPAETPITSINLTSSLLHLRRQVHSTVVTIAADSPLFPLENGQATPLEAEHKAFVVGLAHVADWVLGLRLLDSGFARDVSGVVRITRGGNGENGEDEGADSEREKKEKLEEKEVLYYVGGDGGVKVFERGAGTEAG